MAGERRWSGLHYVLLMATVSCLVLLSRSQNFSKEVESRGQELLNKLQEIKRVNGDNIDIIFAFSLLSEELEVKPAFQFVNNILSVFSVSYNQTRVAFVYGNVADKGAVCVDQITSPAETNNKCVLIDLQDNLQCETFTSKTRPDTNPVIAAMSMFRKGRPSATKVLILVSNMNFESYNWFRISQVQQKGYTWLAFGYHSFMKLPKKSFTYISTGNVVGNYTPSTDIIYAVTAWKKIEDLGKYVTAHQAVLETSITLNVEESHCSPSCKLATNCTCDTYKTTYDCICYPGHFGGRTISCNACPAGTYLNSNGQEDLTSCTPCPHPLMTSAPASSSEAQCVCPPNLKKQGNSCEDINCEFFGDIENGVIVNYPCYNQVGVTCRFACSPGYVLRGSDTRRCLVDGTWTGEDTVCEGIHYEPSQPTAGNSCDLVQKIDAKEPTGQDQCNEAAFNAAIDYWKKCSQHYCAP